MSLKKILFIFTELLLILVVIISLIIVPLAIPNRSENNITYIENTTAIRGWSYIVFLNHVPFIYNHCDILSNIKNITLGIHCTKGDKFTLFWSNTTLMDYKFGWNTTTL